MKVWHMSGAGNDFMVMDARDCQKDLQALAIKLCKLTGADGFMAAGRSEIADLRLHFYNSDGSQAELCGNGSRCISRFAYENGIAGSQVTIETDAGIAQGWRLSENQFRVQLPAPGPVQLEKLPGIAFVEVGCPHAVQEYPGDLWAEKDKLREQMRHLRWNPTFPKGTNVDYYTWLDKTRVRILSFERGVEDFTLACGTGTGAVAAVLWQQGQVPGGKLTVENPGGTLQVTLEGENGQITKLMLEGSADVIKIYDIEL